MLIVAVVLQPILPASAVTQHTDADGFASDGDSAENGGKKDDVNVGVKTNMFGVNYLMWFEIGIEGKDPMDQEEDDWGGKLEFGYSDKNFDRDIEDYFQLFEDECSLESHTCAGRVARLLDHVRDKVIAPPDYDPRNIVDLLDKYGDAHISDSGWREVDQEEWFEQKYKFVFFIVFSKY